MESILVDCLVSFLVLSVAYSARKDIRSKKDVDPFIKAIRLDCMRAVAEDLTDEFAVYADEFLTQYGNQ